MAVRFPTRPTCDDRGAPLRGEPLRARTCKCGAEARLDADGLCTRCGYWPKATVDKTWDDQERRTGFSAPVSDLDRYRKQLMARQFGNAA